MPAKGARRRGARGGSLSLSSKAYRVTKKHKKENFWKHNVTIMKHVLCNKCNLKFLELDDVKDPNEESIHCDRSNMWFHRPCSGLTTTDFDFVIKKDKCNLWKCLECMSHHGQEKKEISHHRKQIRYTYKYT